jgi:hypothetical protein
VARNLETGEKKPFASVGGGIGNNQSLDLFFGFVKGGLDDVSGKTTNFNVVFGRFSLTVITDPKNFDLLGFTFRFGIPSPPMGSVTGSYTFPIDDTLAKNPKACSK